jgi:serine/threonine-protein phosphatase PP1 catalytic subunit
MIDIAHMKKRVLENPDCVAGFQDDDIAGVLRTVQPLFEEEKALIELDGTVVFVGDIHGDFQTTKAIIQRFCDCDHVVFLGDYIDREPVQWGSILTLTYLLLLKCCFPQKIVLLKGNHECHYLIPCFPYEFEDEIVQRFGSAALHDHFVEVFSVMPLMVLSQRVFAAHGGIIKGVDLKALKNIEKNDTAAVTSLVWSDPAFSPTYRGVGDRFDKHELHRFLEGISAKVFIRGHDYTTLGYSIYGDRCLTLFSSSRYKNEGNKGILVARAEKEVICVSDLCVEDFSTGEWKKYQAARI